jgi:hypothetical protein
MDRDEILVEIRRTANENGGIPLGRARFEHATGIGEHDWGKFWPRFGDAQRDAGFAANQLQAAYSTDYLMTKVIELIRKLGTFPTQGDMRVARHSDRSFPGYAAIRRLGDKRQLASHIIDYCGEKPEYRDVVAICAPLASPTKPINDDGETSEHRDTKYGFVYLIRGHPGECKIGRTNLVDRRVSELGATFPIEQQLIYEIKTDDPSGVEAYWHKRFENKRMRGEWFRLKPSDVKSFKRWKRIF